MTSRSEFFTGKCLRRNLSAVSPGLEKGTYQLTYRQKFPNLTTRAVHTNEYDRIGGHNYYLGDNSKGIAEIGVLCNLEDLDFNRVVSPTK